MLSYDYYKVVEMDVRDYVDNEVNLEDWIGDADGLEQFLNDELWCADSVTGNASGSYYCNAWKAEEALAHNWDLLIEALENMGYGCKEIESGPEYCDVLVRCYVLPEAIAKVVDDLRDDLEEDEEAVIPLF